MSNSDTTEEADGIRVKSPGLGVRLSQVKSFVVTDLGK